MRNFKKKSSNGRSRHELHKILEEGEEEEEEEEEGEEEEGEEEEQEKSDESNKNKEAQKRETTTTTRAKTRNVSEQWERKEERNVTEREFGGKVLSQLLRES